ncbi:SWIM zinc finger family protein [Labrys neptuniae]
MALTLAKIEELAPDQGSIDAARKLLKPSLWPTVAQDEQGLIWGECQGSGSLPYRVVVSEADLGYKCSCPSRKFPCKHTLALMWMRADDKPFGPAERPDWVADWLSRRRPAGNRPAPAVGSEDRPKASLDAVPAEAEAAPDPKALARAAAQRERVRAEREASVLSGLDELDRWLQDQLDRGLAGFPGMALEQCRMLARRLVDAKAHGLAARVEQLPAALFAMPDEERGEFLVQRLGELFLIAEAYRRQADLPPALAADVRVSVGWTISKEALFSEPLAIRQRGRWMVLATVNEVQPDKLRRLETWFGRIDGGEGPRFALMIDFIPVSVGNAGTLYAPGECLDAEMLFYPSTVPLRAIIAEQAGGVEKIEAWQAPAEDLQAAVEDYEARLAGKPWLGDWPIAARDAVVVPTPQGPVLTALTGEATLPLRSKPGDDSLEALAGVACKAVFGIWDGHRLDLKFAETPLGRWIAG